MFTAVSDRSQVAEARRRVSDEAAKIGLPRDRIDQTDIVVTELATNLIKHGDGGFIHARLYDDAGGSGLEILAMDRGKLLTACTIQLMVWIHDRGLFSRHVVPLRTTFDEQVRGALAGN